MRFGAAILLIPVLVFGGLLALYADEKLLPVIPPADPSATRCVEPTEVMRRRHYEFILHQRDETVHAGIRTEQYRFVNCINCHVQPTADGDYPRHTESEHFCTACHQYSSVNIDCFSCHADRPEAAYSNRGEK